MSVDMKYMIMRPIQLPWLFVSPLDTRGLEYHLTPDLSICMEGIISGEQEFIISHVMMGIEGIEVNEIVANQMFINEFLPGKSKERLVRAFKNDGVSCFFTIKQMEYLQKLFEERNFMSYNVTVMYKDKRVEEIEMLPPKEFKLVSDVFADLDVQFSCSYKTNKEAFEGRYNEGYEKKIASTETKNKATLWEKVKDKNVLKRIGTSVGAIALGIGGMLVRSKLASLGGVGGTIAALVLGTAGVVLELYGRSEAQDTLVKLKFEQKTERMAFN